MLCSKCKGFNVQQISLVNSATPGMVVEEWKCYDCGNIMSVVVPAPAYKPYQISNIPTVAVPNVAASVTVAPTRLEKINAYWDTVKKLVDDSTELEQKMIYYYLNKKGMTMTNLGYQIERDLNKMHPEEKKQK
jgi:hypothetical protein